MRLSLIVAVAENGVIGRAGRLPWRLPADLCRFKQLTMGRWIIMGRKTFESIGRLLPGRTSVVITRQVRFDAQGARIAASLEDALRQARGQEEAFVIGGAQIYRIALPRADRIYMTLVHAHAAGDTRFPPWPADQWRLVQSQRREADEKNPLACSFLVYDRIRETETP